MTFAFGAAIASAADLGFRIIDDSVSLLERLAINRPVVVAFEDLHWADPSTLRAVRAIGRALPDLPARCCRGNSRGRQGTRCS